MGVKKLSPIEQLDYVLAFFVKNPSDIGFGKMRAVIMIVADKVINDRTLTALILDKLVKDQYLTLQEHYSFAGELIADGGDHYVLTFDGAVFHQQGGYKQQMINANQNEYQTKSYARRLIWATWSAGIVAFILLLWQVFIYIWPPK
ncbi:MAG TPA: hypothetical protein VNW95_01110 [Mucilaginibacter sp.]|jgi:hypothetical protein|nr:hypothetical protein [Mucilaginibacter sp.]